ncbi:hypothetical protein FBEOM_2463 [Fusarium beomiforme]|uniref:Uncharacterized protein n=1 Tax=Fusarium beomiforme TaxID=44412 RepID=A0A9P5ARS2_9HYPO|nr:hypothetical protein FBEOM_2463 [Fusarium beomiforme]
MSKLVEDVKSGLKGIRGAGDALRGEVLDATDQAFDPNPNHPETLKDRIDNRTVAEKGKQDMKNADNMIARREWEHKGVEPPAHVGRRENEEPLATQTEPLSRTAAHGRPNEGLTREPEMGHFGSRGTENGVVKEPDANLPKYT